MKSCTSGLLAILLIFVGCLGSAVAADRFYEVKIYLGNERQPVSIVLPARGIGSAEIKRKDATSGNARSFRILASVQPGKSEGERVVWAQIAELNKDNWRILNEGTADSAFRNRATLPPQGTSKHAAQVEAAELSLETLQKRCKELAPDTKVTPKSLTEYSPLDCCSTGCLTCCGGCCADPTNCPHGCCP